MKQVLKTHKYLLPSAAVLIATMAMLAFDTSDALDFLAQFGKTLLYAAATAFGVYIVSMLSGWLLYPIAPKYEDFSSDEERERYFDLGSWDLSLLIYAIIAATLVFNNRI